MLITPPYTFPAVYSDGTVSTYSQERDANMRKIQFLVYINFGLNGSTVFFGVSGVHQ